MIEDTLGFVFPAHGALLKYIFQFCITLSHSISVGGDDQDLVVVHDPVTNQHHTTFKKPFHKLRD